MKFRQAFVDAYPEMDEKTKQGILNGTLDRYYVKMDLEKERAEKAITDRREGYIQTHLKIGSRTKEAIRNGKIFIGMNEEQVIASWGDPDDKNRTIGSWGIHEQWIYGTDIKYRNYLYFENKKLTSWQD